jgi:hypothetical protein
VPSVAAPRGVYRASYARPTGRYGSRLPPPVVPAGRGPGGAGILAAILGPIGGLTGCLCCLNTIGVWGLFITAIPLTVFMSKFICHCHLILLSMYLTDPLLCLSLFKVDGCVITRVVLAKTVLKNWSFLICFFYWCSYVRICLRSCDARRSTTTKWICLLFSVLFISYTNTTHGLIFLFIPHSFPLSSATLRIFLLISPFFLSSIDQMLETTDIAHTMHLRTLFSATAKPT